MVFQHPAKVSPFMGLRVRIPPLPPKKLLTTFIIKYILSIYKIYININNKNMNSTIINIKTDPKIKKEAQKITAKMGLTLSGAINGFLRQLIRNKTMLFTLNENTPSDYLLSSIKESEKERKDGNFYSFKNNKEAIRFLDK